MTVRPLGRRELLGESAEARSRKPGSPAKGLETTAPGLRWPRKRRASCSSSRGSVGVYAVTHVQQFVAHSVSVASQTPPSRVEDDPSFPRFPPGQQHEESRLDLVAGCSEPRPKRRSSLWHHISALSSTAKDVPPDAWLVQAAMAEAEAGPKGALFQRLLQAWVAPGPGTQNPTRSSRHSSAWMSFSTMYAAATSRAASPSMCAKSRKIEYQGCAAVLRDIDLKPSGLYAQDLRSSSD